ncbi:MULTISPECIES: response regulator transcription factor [unclassified Streptomyces]|uniref:response regulator transcription factor n=1 Tax=unclassified Streptomyces TaxID=2593676 RepID=UPI002E2D881B|nr:response regulator transcription factor [Streptomyces sp. NBC_01429]
MIVAEDSALLRQGLVRLLTDLGIVVAAEVGDGDGLLALVAAERPDVVLLDIRMPPTHTDEGIRAALAIREGFAGTGVLLLSQYVETTSAVQAMARDCRGFGYLLKDRVADAGELSDALQRVAAGETVMDPEVVARLMGRRRATNELDALTPREREVLALMAEGRSNEAITERLRISGKTLETHVRNVFTKLLLEPDLGYHRRVLAVLAHLRA